MYFPTTQVKPLGSNCKDMCEKLIFILLLLLESFSYNLLAPTMTRRLKISNFTRLRFERA